MGDWIDYYDSTPSVYVGPRHREAHFRLLAEDIRRLIPSQQAVVLDFACGEALSADAVAAACATLTLAEPAPSVRQRLAQRFSNVSNIKVLSLDDLDSLQDRSIDLIVMNSVLQYMTAEQLAGALATSRRLLKPSGQLVIGDVLRPDAGMLPDVIVLLKMAFRYGFFIDALTGLVRTALSDYSRLHKTLGLKRYSESDMLARLRGAGFDAQRRTENLGHNPTRMTFVATPAAADEPAPAD